MKIVLFLVFFMGCSSPSIIDPPPNPQDASVDTNICDLNKISYDIYNCGLCGRVCNPSYSDNCFDSRCVCGPSSQCEVGSRCWRGQCIPRSPDGTNCEFDDQCGAGYICVEGHCSFVECVPEVCDGIDNDCDGVIDGTGFGAIAEFCYKNGVMITEELPLPCMTGVRFCHNGIWSECEGSVPPLPETGLLACDGIDNDCDGCVDGVLHANNACLANPAQYFDVLFVIDSSGSMTDEINVVRQAIRIFSRRLSGPNLQWGIVLVPGSTDGVPELYLNLTDFVTFETELLAMVTGAGSVEPQWDAVYDSVNGGLGVSWREFATRIIILFTDEQGQSERTRGLTETDMCNAMTKGEVFIPVTDSRFLVDFDDCAHSTLELVGGDAGSGNICSSTSECVTDETCVNNLCITEVVSLVADQLNIVIADPCTGI